VDKRCSIRILVMMSLVVSKCLSEYSAVWLDVVYICRVDYQSKTAVVEGFFLFQALIAWHTYCFHDFAVLSIFFGFGGCILVGYLLHRGQTSTYRRKLDVPATTDRD